MTQEERYYAVKSCRFVDQIVEAAPYITSVEVMREWGCEVCVHGDDVVTGSEGQDVYEEVKRAGMYREVKRTPSVSTTDLLCRMLTLSTCKADNVMGIARLVEFANDCDLKPLPSSSNIVYIDGTFDLVHVGHLAALEQARALGDYLLVGLHDDTAIEQACRRTPIMTMEERLLSLMACKWVDNIIVGAPLVPTAAFLRRHRISTVVFGRLFEYKSEDMDCYQHVEPVARLVQLPAHPFSMVTAESILKRVQLRRNEYEERNARKAIKDAGMRARGFV